MTRVQVDFCQERSCLGVSLGLVVLVLVDGEDGKSLKDDSSNPKPPFIPF